jgi:hypothetical protein
VRSIIPADDANQITEWKMALEDKLFAAADACGDPETVAAVGDFVGNEQGEWTVDGEPLTARNVKVSEARGTVTIRGVPLDLVNLSGSYEDGDLTLGDGDAEVVIQGNTCW